jgi:hypothetical protein
MAERDLPWYLFGAQAAIVWGSLRLSADVDVTQSALECGGASYRFQTCSLLEMPKWIM